MLEGFKQGLKDYGLGVNEEVILSYNDRNKLIFVPDDGEWEHHKGILICSPSRLEALSLRPTLDEAPVFWSAGRISQSIMAGYWDQAFYLTSALEPLLEKNHMS